VKLLMLNAAPDLESLRIPPGNRLEPLGGDRAGQHSIGINDQWRICFRWRDGNVLDVEITDYHWMECVMRRDFAPIHPGEILLEEFLKPMGITQYRLAKDIGVPPRRINEIVQGKRAISADTALRLGRFFVMSAQFWINLQAHYDLEIAQEAIGDRLDHEVKIYRAEAYMQNAAG